MIRKILISFYNTMPEKVKKNVYKNFPNLNDFISKNLKIAKKCLFRDA